MKMMKLGWNLSGNNKEGIILSKGNNVIRFDIPVSTPEGVLWCIYLQRLDSTSTSNEEATFVQVQYSIDKTHEILGHLSDTITRKICGHLDWKLSRGTLQPCESCGIGKATQRNLERHGTIPENIGYIWYIDGMTLKITEASKGPFPSRNCFVAMTEGKTDHGFSGWFTSKSGFIGEFARKFYFIIERRKFKIKLLRGDGAGENKSFYDEITGPKWKIVIEASWTPRATPQPNRVENPIYVVCMRARAIMAAANVPDTMKNILFSYAVRMLGS